MAEVTMPRLSDTMEEGTIAAWLKKPGEQVNKGDVIAQIETDKATMDLTAFEAGTLQEILAPEGATVAIGKPVARIGSGGPRSDTPSAAPPAEEETDSEKPERPEAKEDVSEAPKPAAPKSEQPTVSPAAEQPSPDGANGKVRASPMARHIAAEHGLELSDIQGSGPQGRVVRADVEAAVKSDAKPAEEKAPPVPQGPSADGEERIQLSQMRRTIARRMAESTRTVPHFFLTTLVDATELGALRKQINAQAETKVSFNDLIVKGAALAIRKVPEVNVSFAEDSLIRHSHVHVGVAVATDRGLIVPVIKDADQKSVGQIGREARDLAERAAAGKLQPNEYSGGTFTVSNLGMYGIEQFQAVINPPESAILAVGAITREPAEHNGEIALRDRLRLTLSVDHRALDGAVGARYLQALKALLEKPMLLLV
jgi:pyruvate dehydrogenase E2 component (dihydrolipoyllysine-residue acetyltransferase)